LRYREGQAPDAVYPYSEPMHHMLSLSMVLSIVIGAVLLALGIRGKVMWLKVWSVGLIFCSVVYLVGDGVGLL